MKKNMMAAMTAAMMVAMTIPAYAGEWKQNDNIWQYVQDNGTNAANGWSKINGVWYYFDAEGHMLAGTSTPDGYTVSANGAWDGKDVQATGNTTGADFGFTDVLYEGMTDEEANQAMYDSLKAYWSTCPKFKSYEQLKAEKNHLYYNYNPRTTLNASYIGWINANPNLPYVAKVYIGGNWTDQAYSWSAEYLQHSAEVTKNILYRTLGIAETERIWPTIVADGDRTIAGYLPVLDENGNEIPIGGGQYKSEYHETGVGDGLRLSQDITGITASGNRYIIVAESRTVEDSYFVHGNTLLIYKK